MSFIPKFRLYDSTGSALLYTFPAVNSTNAPQSIENFVEIESLRAQGSIIIEGGIAPWDLDMSFTLLGEDYEDVTSKIVTLENTVLFNTPYVLRIDKTAGSFFEYKVKRLQPFTYPENLRNSYQRVSVTLRVNSW